MGTAFCSTLSVSLGKVGTPSSAVSTGGSTSVSLLVVSPSIVCQGQTVVEYSWWKAAEGSLNEKRIWCIWLIIF